MNKSQFIKQYFNFLKEEKLTNQQAWVASGGTLLLLGLRKETEDIDMDVPADIFNKIRKRNLPEIVLSDGTIVIEYNKYVDVHLDDGTKEHTVIEDVGSWTIQEVLKLKNRLNRPKDQNDIKNIKEYLKKQKQSDKEFSIKSPAFLNWN